MVSCTCQICGNEYKTDIIVPDKLWESIKPTGKPVGGGLLCGSCIVQGIEEIFGYSAWKLEAIEGKNNE